MFRTGILQNHMMLIGSFSTLAPGSVNNCPSRWIDRNGVIQFSWAAPQRPNGVLRRYYIILTSFDGRTVIASESYDNTTLSAELSNANLGKWCRCT